MKLKWKSSANSERLLKLYASLSYVQKQLTVVPSYQLHYKLIKNLDKPSTPNDERYQLRRGSQRLHSTDMVPLYREFRGKDQNDDIGPERNLPQLRHFLLPILNCH